MPFQDICEKPEIVARDDSSCSDGVHHDWEPSKYAESYMRTQFPTEFRCRKCGAQIVCSFPAEFVPLTVKHVDGWLVATGYSRTPNK